MKTLILVRPFVPYQYPLTEIKARAFGLELASNYRSLIRSSLNIVTSDDAAGCLSGVHLSKVVGLRSIDTTNKLGRQYFDLNYQMEIFDYLDIEMSKVQTLIAIGTTHFFQAAETFCRESLGVGIEREHISPGEGICVLESLGCAKLIPKVIPLQLVQANA